MPVGAVTGGRALLLSDAVLATGEGYQDFKDLNGNRQFKPRFIHADSSDDQAEEALGYCTIDGFLIGENETDRRTWRIYTRTPVGLAFARIYSANTTGRGIKLVAEY